jgi:hypothetical protein
MKEDLVEVLDQRDWFVYVGCLIVVVVFVSLGLVNAFVVIVMINIYKYVYWILIKYKQVTHPSTKPIPT